MYGKAVQDTSKDTAPDRYRRGQATLRARNLQISDISPLKKIPFCAILYMEDGDFPHLSRF